MTKLEQQQRHTHMAVTFYVFDTPVQYERSCSCVDARCACLGA